MINPKLREEIKLKMDKIKSSPRSYDSRMKIIRDGLRTLGDCYSFWIENPELRKDLLLENKKEATIKREAKKGIRHITDAWYYLYDSGKNKDFVDVLCPEIIIGANSISLGGKASAGGFRKDKEFSSGDVSLGFAGYYTPPSATKVPKKIDDMIHSIRDEYSEDPLSAAIFTHLNMALIQPFADGNKRTARLLQDRILFDNSYPPAIIPAGDAVFYRELLRRVAPFYEKGNCDGQKIFYDYIASKVNQGLDLILDDLTVPQFA